jgi:hypothetical protein
LHSEILSGVGNSDVMMLLRIPKSCIFCLQEIFHGLQEILTCKQEVYDLLTLVSSYHVIVAHTLQKKKDISSILYLYYGSSVAILSYLLHNDQSKKETHLLYLLLVRHNLRLNKGIV